VGEPGARHHAPQSRRPHEVGWLVTTSFQVASRRGADRALQPGQGTPGVRGEMNVSFESDQDELIAVRVDDGLEDE
jgi:hypothetical protein